jgi:hypothetical protein
MDCGSIGVGWSMRNAEKLSDTRTDGFSHDGHEEHEGHDESIDA